MTQCEVDAKLSLISQGFANLRYEVNKDYHSRRAELNKKRQAIDEAYNQVLIETQWRLSTVLNERCELKRQGLDAFNEQMQANYNAERNLHDLCRTHKQEWLRQIYDLKRQHSELQLEFERRHKELREQQHIEISNTYAEYQSINQSINQSVTQADAYAKAYAEQSDTTES